MSGTPTIPNKLGDGINVDDKNKCPKRIPRPANAFMIFGQMNRKKFANLNPDFTNKQISKLLGNEWRAMPADEKAKFQQLSGKAHADHMAKYPGYYYSPLEARQRKAERKRNQEAKRGIDPNKENADGKDNAMHKKVNLQSGHCSSVDFNTCIRMQDDYNIPLRPLPVPFPKGQFLRPTTISNDTAMPMTCSHGTMFHPLNLPPEPVKKRPEMDIISASHFEHQYAQIADSVAETQPNENDTNLVDMTDEEFVPPGLYHVIFNGTEEEDSDQLNRHNDTVYVVQELSQIDYESFMTRYLPSANNTTVSEIVEDNEEQIVPTKDMSPVPTNDMSPQKKVIVLEEPSDKSLPPALSVTEDDDDN